MARKRTGTIIRLKDGRWQAVITLADGSRKRLPPFPKGMSEAMAREKTVAASEMALKVGAKCRTPLPLKLGKNAGGLDWWRAYLAHREADGLSSVDSMYHAHIEPVLGDLHPKSWNLADCERLRDALDAKAREGSWTKDGRRYRFGGKRALNVWALFTSACKAASRSKVAELRCRDNNPCHEVLPPDAGAKKQKQWLFPSEFSALVECKQVPERWRLLYCLLTYSYLRPGELQTLLWSDIDLDAGLIHVHRAWDRGRGEVKDYPKSTAGVRYVPIEVELLPLLRRLHSERQGSLVVASMPPAEDWASTFRTHLKRAGIARAALFTDSASVKHITFYDLRATGITWRTLRQDDTRHIQSAAGHESYSTTQGYVRQNQVFSGRVGHPFPPLPSSLISNESISESLHGPESDGSGEKKAGLVASPRGFEPLLQP